MAHQLTETNRQNLIAKLKSCKLNIYYADERAADLIEGIIRCLESDEDSYLDEFLTDIYPAIQKHFKN